ncbi:O-methyltransferase [Anaeromyces robustus]|uniref:O-methyltransferase n=1 Tax=Anaeromyces robustus TaxID=1754192 RepID=A0A1Y1XFE5_9FUNG|nr:O-methyltransferase [Anaeromyces robustus]|eukprot:ORX84475.1 O-methyltransferase [Anaeromyces robustus]
MEEFTEVSDTLFIPLRGRIYSTENFPEILKDEEALKIKDKLPPEKGKQSQYTFMASAVRARNMDRYIKQFLDKNNNEDCIIVELGCGLETSFYRNDNGKAHWYELDLPEVINYRRQFFKETERCQFIEGDIKQVSWINKLKLEVGSKPILFSAGGLFHYFPKEDVLKIIRNLCQFENSELVFDTLNHLGIKGIKRYMKQIGHEQATMYFYVDDGNVLVKEIGEPTVELLKEEKYYCEIPKSDLDFTTKVSMRVSDLCNMVKMIHLKLK